MHNVETRFKHRIFLLCLGTHNEYARVRGCFIVVFCPVPFLRITANARFVFVSLLAYIHLFRINMAGYGTNVSALCPYSQLSVLQCVTTVAAPIVT